jgi:hypothetical protein
MTTEQWGRAFLANEDLLRMIARRFCRRFRTDPDETEAEAFWHFRECLLKHDPARSHIRQRVQAVVWARLMNWHATQRRKRKFLGRRISPHQESRPSLAFSLPDLTRRLSDDAALAVALLVDTKWAWENPGRIKIELRRVLRSQFLMSPAQVRQVFREVQEVLS